MKKNFSVGDYVAWLDDDLQGKIIQLKLNTIVVETSDGFEIEATASELVILPKQEELKLDWDALQKAKQLEFERPKKKLVKKSFKKRNIPAIEIDLHIHELVEHTKNLSNFDMLNIQLNAAKRQINFAKQKKIKRVILIHGVGQGVLKAELETILRRDEEVDFYDADYKTYGLGATEVYIYENK